MIKVIDTTRINRYALTANAASIGGLLLLLASVVLPLFFQSMATLSLILMIAGMGIAMVGIYYANRWVRKPRPEEQIEKALKGLSDGFILFHYPRMPIDHMLLTPTGVLIIETISYASLFTYRDGKWKEGMTLGRAFRYIVEEHLGDPGKMVTSEAELLREKFIQNGCPHVPIKKVILFSHPNAKLDIKDPPLPVCKVDKLRKHAEIPGAKISPEEYEKVRTYLESQTL